MEKATFGAGCFWHVEEAFRHMPGVIDTAVGFMGGWTKNPTYRDVCAHGTGHAEVVQITYDPSKISYERLLGIFWDIHDPTTLDRQGPDVGDQYRSVVFHHTDEQRATALASREQVEKSGKFKKPVVTRIQPAGDFYRAEEYHQQYFEKRGISVCGMRAG